MFLQKNIGKCFDKLSKLVAFFVFFLLPLFLSAQSSMGKDIEYVYLGTSGGNNQYKVTVRLFWNSWDFVNNTVTSAAPAFVTLKAVGCSINTSFTLNVDYDAFGGIIQCPDYQLGCANSLLCTSADNQVPPFQKVRAYYYSDTISLPTGCSQIYLGVDDCCRAANVINIQNPTSSQAAILAVINTNVQNSSVHFINVPAPFVCVGSSINIDHIGADVENDS
ncbi:MAG TPA: hypothetical protein VGB95_05840, partial [Chitinophagales bacterium]